MKSWMYIFFFFAFATCIEPYTPNVVSSSNNILVVEGVIKTNTTIKISRTSGLGESAILPEAGAQVWIESNEQSTKTTLTEVTAGQYTGVLTMNTSDTYRLGITTGSKTYYSDFVTVNNAPAVEDVTWKIIEDGSIEIDVSATGTNEDSRYYRWNFAETWEFYSQYNSALKYENHKLVVRNPEDNLNHCYKTVESSSVLINSTQTLSQNTVEGFPIQNINMQTSAKLDVRYSVLVRQYVMTKDAFQFWQVLQKNTQNLGTLFGPQPSQLKSNIHNATDQSEAVIGFISAGEVSEKRIFIGRDELPVGPRITRYPKCKLDTVDVNPQNIDITFTGGAYIPVTSVGVYIPTGYLYSSADCIDCRLDGGIFSKPDFWKD